MHDPDRGLLRVEDLDEHVLVDLAAQDARVADLAAGLGVEGRLGEQDLEDPLLGGAPAPDARGRLEVIVADELLGGALVDGLPVAGAGGLGVDVLAARDALVLGPGLAVAVHVDLQILLPGHHLGQIGREPVGGVELEDLLAGELGAAPVGGLIGDLLEERQPAVDGRKEALLLQADQLAGLLAHALELRVHVPVALDDRLGDLVQERAVKAQAAPVAHRPAQDAAHHRAAPLVGELGPVAQREQHRADVIGDDRERGEVLARIEGFPGSR